MRTLILFTPLLLTALRGILAPVVVALALYYPNQIAFGGCLVAAFLSDVFDGIIARRLGIATPELRRLDSIADSLFYLSAVFAAWHLEPAIINENIIGLLILGLIEVARYIYDFLKFKREASYHMWSSKLWGIFLFLGFFNILVFGQSGFFVQAAILLGILADLEGLAISIVLKEMRSDVPTLIHALKKRY